MSSYNKSLHDMNASVPMYKGSSKMRKHFTFLGVGLMIAVGYMDPGNWATDISGGAKFGYTLLFVILFSNIMAMILQYLALKLGIATDKDLAQACRTYLPVKINYLFWVLCELSIIACDLAELLGSAIALKLLFDIPIIVGVSITVVDVLLILFLQNKGFRYIELFVLNLVALIFLCFGYEILIAQPDVEQVLSGFIPTTDIFSNDEMLFIAIGILGATVMPHNLYLHSSVVQTRNYSRNNAGRKEAIHYAAWDSFISLFLALFVNAAILIVSATVFYKNQISVEALEETYHLLSPALGDNWASIVFALALLFSGQSSTITSTLAGQVVMEGFLNMKLRPWIRRLLTRSLAIIPAVLVILIGGEQQTTSLLILSQVILSMQLSFAVIPLVYYTSNRTIMQNFVNSSPLTLVSWVVAVLICSLNLYLIANFFWLS